jgi:O-antigen/teichoic acid export membrane protein
LSLPFFLAQSYGMVFRGRDRMDLGAGVSTVNRIALLGLALVALALGKRLPGVLVAQALSGFLTLALANRLYRRVTTGPLRYSRQLARDIRVGNGAFFAFNVANNIQSYIDAVILSKLAPADAVGWFGAAKNITGTLFARALILGAASFSRLARAAANRGAFKAEARAVLRPMLWLGAFA